jgi:hypothetical protein
VARRRQLNPCATSRDGRHIHGSRRVGRVMSHRTGRIIRLGTARCNCGGRADEVGGDGGPDVFLLGEGDRGGRGVDREEGIDTVYADRLFWPFGGVFC